MTSDLEPQGFDVLAGLAASLAPADPGTTLSPSSTKRPGDKTSTASTAGEARNHRLEAARQKVAERQVALAQMELDVEQADATADDANEQYQRLAEELGEAEKRAQVATAKAAAKKAQAARRRKLSRLETAQRQLERLEG